VDNRDNSFFRNRLDWDLHVSHLNREGSNAFFKMYRMHNLSHMKVCFLIDDTVKKNNEKVNNKANAPITTQIALHCCIR